MIQPDHQRDNLKAFADGELPIRTRLAVRLHLLRCGECRREIHEMTDISNSLKTNDAGTLDDALRTRILSAVPDAAPDVPADLPPVRLRFPRKRIPLYAFGMSATALVGWFVLYPALNPAPQGAMSGATSAKSGAADSGRQATAKPVAAEQSYSLSTPSRAYAPAPASASETADASDSAAIAGSASKSAPAVGQDKQRQTASFAAPAARMKSAEVIPADGERKVHREASLTLEVDRTETRSETVSTMTKTAGGYVANDTLQTEEDGTKTASLTLKIPVSQFESFLAQLSHLGDVKAKSLSGEDITEKTSDQEQTVRVVGGDAQDLERKIQKARRASRRDEESLRQLRIREAQAQAHLKLLRTLGALADITVELREKPKAEPAKPQQGGFINDMNDTAHGAIAAFAQAARLPIVLLIWAVVYLPLFLVLLIGYRIAARFWTRYTP